MVVSTVVVVGVSRISVVVVGSVWSISGSIAFVDVLSGAVVVDGFATKSDFCQSKQSKYFFGRIIPKNRRSGTWGHPGSKNWTGMKKSAFKN